MYPMAQVAAERVKHAVRSGETIGIIGDYDCDGVTSSAILVRMLRRLDTEPIVRLPHRLREGYGVNMTHIDEMTAAGVTLLLTTDTGIVAHEPLKRAKERGIDVIVIDHHSFVEPPPAYAVLHPAMTSLRSPPAAAGVAFAFAHAVLGETWPDHDTDIALAAIGTIADVVPLTHENRTLVKDGLAAIVSLDRGSPVRQLLDAAGSTSPVTSSDIAFRIAPRLNAAGRLDNATIGLRALLGDVASINTLETLNAERQRLTQECMEEAFASIHTDNIPSCICIASERFPRGIVGLIAGKLTERFGRPSLAATIENGLCTASLRGIPGHDIAHALRANAQLFTAFGGHALAGGCSFPLSNFGAVTKALCDDVRASMNEHDLVPVVVPDAVLDASSATLSLADALASLEPFGAGNREPLFLLKNIELSSVRRIGSGKNHLQARTNTSSVIGFHLGHLEHDVRGRVDIVCRVTANAWNGQRSPQLSIVDIRRAAPMADVSNNEVRLRIGNLE